MNTTSQTLSERIASGRIPVADALRIGMLVADQLRRMHEQGAVHGGLTPAAIEIDGPGVRLLPASSTAATPYTAPEILKGRPADARSDIFSFGAIFLEMLPGGSPAVDRLVATCLAPSPDARFQRAQKLILELKLLTAGARRSAPARAPARVPEIQNGMQEFEGRIAVRLAEQEKSVASVAQVASEVLKALREQQPAAPVYSERPPSRTEHSTAALEDKLARIDLVVGSLVERLRKLEENFDQFDTDAAALRDSVTRDIRNFERALKAQNTAIDSARTAMGQTDDLVERVVEALDSLQSMFVATAEERSLAS